MSVHAGKKNERKWEEYWNSLRALGKYLPVKTSGKVNVAQVGRDSKIGRENLYKNPNIHPKLLAAIEETLIAQREAVTDVPETGSSVQVSRRREDVTHKQIESQEWTMTILSPYPKGPRLAAVPSYQQIIRAGSFM